MEFRVGWQRVGFLTLNHNLAHGSHSVWISEIYVIITGSTCATMRRVAHEHITWCWDSRTGLAVSFVPVPSIFPPLETCPCVLAVWLGLAIYVGASRVTVPVTI